MPTQPWHLIERCWSPASSKPAQRAAARRKRQLGRRTACSRSTSAECRSQTSFSRRRRGARCSGEPCPFFAHGGVAFDGDCGAALQIVFEGRPRPSGALRHPSPHRPPDPRRARKPTSGAVVPLNHVRTGGGRGASVPRPPGAGVPGWFGPGRRLGPPVALRHMRGWLVSARRVLPASPAAPRPKKRIPGSVDGNAFN